MVKGVSEAISASSSSSASVIAPRWQGKDLNLTLGFSHPVVFKAPEGITIEVPTQTEILIKGTDKQRVGEVAAKIRAFRRRNPTRARACVTRARRSPEGSQEGGSPDRASNGIQVKHVTAMIVRPATASSRS